MGTRNLLHINQLNSFTNWLKKDGWEIYAPKGMYEALRAKKEKRWIIVYRRANPREHLSLRDKDCDIVRQFLKSAKSVFESAIDFNKLAILISAKIYLESISSSARSKNKLSSSCLSTTVSLQIFTVIK